MAYKSHFSVQSLMTSPLSMIKTKSLDLKYAITKDI